MRPAIEIGRIAAFFNAVQAVALPAKFTILTLNTRKTEMVNNEKEFSFKNYFVYVLRKWIIPVLCVLVGAAVGLYYSVSFKNTNVEVYEGTIRFNLEEYIKLFSPEGGITEGDYSLHTATAESVMQIATDSIVKTKTYEQMRDKIYPGIKDEGGKRDSFFKSIKAERENYVVKVDFAYDINSDADVQTAKEVVAAYLNFAVEMMKNSNANLKSDNAVISVSEVVRNYDAASMSELVVNNAAPSLVSSLLIGAVGGAVLGIVIISLVYVFDPRIKSVGYILPDDKSGVIHADKQSFSEGAYVSLLTAFNKEGAKDFLIASAVKDDAVKQFSEGFADYLKSAGKQVTVKAFGENGSDWRTFEKDNDGKDLCVYVYSDAEDGALGYLSGQVGKTCLLIDQAAVPAKKFVSAVNEITAAGGDYFGVVLFNTTDSYLE